MSAQWFVTWWNLVFIVPFLLALLYLGIYTASGLTFGEGDVDADADADVDADADMDADADVDAHVEVDGDVHIDADADADVDADADADADADTDTDGDGEASAHGDADSEAEMPLYLAVLSWLGLGRVPLSILLMVLLLTWGVIGFLLNTLLWAGLGPMVAAVSLPAAALGSALLTRGVARLMGRWMPSMETYAHRRDELIGLVGEAIFQIDQQSGKVAVSDKYGDRFQIPCRVSGDRPPIDKGARVLLVSRDDAGWFYVIPYELKTESSRNL